MTLLEARSISTALGGKQIFTGLDFALGRGESWGVLGPSGAGKTTLLHGLAGLRPPDLGEVLVEGRNITEYPRKSLARKAGILFQDSRDTFPATVLETVLTGRYPHLSFWSFESPEDVGMAMAALDQVSLSGMSGRQVDTLSGGERRRTAIASLLVQAPEIWLLDEPVNHLDMHHQISLLRLMVDKAAGNRGGIVMVLHDVNLVMRFCSHALLMIDADTRVSGPVSETLTVENLHALYRHPVKMMRNKDMTLFYPA